MSAMKIKKGDTVRVIAGKDKGKEWWHRYSGRTYQCF